MKKQEGRDFRRRLELVRVQEGGKWTGEPIAQIWDDFPEELAIGDYLLIDGATSLSRQIDSLGKVIAVEDDCIVVRLDDGKRIQLCSRYSSISILTREEYFLRKLRWRYE